jgi:hypothetical protein
MWKPSPLSERFARSAGSHGFPPGIMVHKGAESLSTPTPGNGRRLLFSPVPLILRKQGHADCSIACYKENRAMCR